MLRDWGSWDANFNAVTAEVRNKLVDVVHGQDTHVCVPMQGSGTFSVEAAINTLVPRTGHVLVLINGAYWPAARQAHADDGRARSRRSRRRRTCRPRPRTSTGC